MVSSPEGTSDHPSLRAEGRAEALMVVNEKLGERNFQFSGTVARRPPCPGFRRDGRPAPRARPTTARRAGWTTGARTGGGRRTGTRTGGGRRTGTRARSGSRSAPTCAEHGRLQRILRSLGLGRVWFCVVFSKLNTPR